MTMQSTFRCVPALIDSFWTIELREVNFGSPKIGSPGQFDLRPNT